MSPKAAKLSRFVDTTKLEYSSTVERVVSLTDENVCCLSE